MPDILLHLTPSILASLLYLVLALLACDSKGTVFSFISPPKTSPTAETTKHLATLHIITVLASVFHGTALVSRAFQDGSMFFSASIACSLTLWLSVLFYSIERHWIHIGFLRPIIYGIAAIAVLLPTCFTSRTLIPYTQHALFKIHFILAVTAYSLFTLAAFHAVLMGWLKRKLQQKTALLPAGIPPLLLLEKVLFRQLYTAWTLLTLTIISGVYFFKHLDNLAFPDLKSVLTLLAWCIYGTLFVGHRQYGWRGRIATHASLIGFAALAIAYASSFLTTPH